MKNIDGEKCYSVKDVEELFGVGKDSIYCYERAGLQSKKYQGKRYFTEAQLKDFLLSMQRKRE